ncbi:dihydrofolate reductase family protein [Mesorhizobium sp. M0292]|uniref:dihydrofolate reductase family protein n=1 Tax=Mesorhizobium sp. M0292 TaxID=2956929 RepID=UPI00333B0C5C
MIVTEFISVDGIAEVEKLPKVTWNDEMQRFKEDELSDSGAMLLGRTTYEIFAGLWPSETGDFADRFNALPKFVASTSLKTVDWKPVELLKGSLAEAVRDLKQGNGGNIYVHGSLSVAQELLRHGLVDRARLLSYPGSVGEGKKLFSTDMPVALEPISAMTFSNGVVALEYAAGGVKDNLPPCGGDGRQARGGCCPASLSTRSPLARCASYWLVKPQMLAFLHTPLCLARHLPRKGGDRQHQRRRPARLTQPPSLACPWRAPRPLFPPPASARP